MQFHYTTQDKKCRKIYTLQTFREYKLTQPELLNSRLHLHVGCQQSAGTEVHGVVNWPLIHVQEARGKVDRAVCQWNCTFDQGSGVLLRLSVVVFFLFISCLFFHVSRGTADYLFTPTCMYTYGHVLYSGAVLSHWYCVQIQLCAGVHIVYLWPVQMSKNQKHVRWWLMIRQNFGASDCTTVCLKNIWMTNITLLYYLYNTHTSKWIPNWWCLGHSSGYCYCLVTL